LERDLPQALHSPNSTPQQFEKARIRVDELAKYCESRRNKIVSHVLENYEKGVWNKVSTTIEIETVADNTAKQNIENEEE